MVKDRPQFVITRRSLLCAALAPHVVGCQSSKGTTPTSKSKPNAQHESLDWGGLTGQVLSTVPEGERGGTAVVLLHGFGARGDDLVSFAQRLSRPKCRFFLPAAPLPRGESGRAWWDLTIPERPAHAWDGKVPLAYQPHAQVLAARKAVQTLLGSIRTLYAPDRLVLSGFSQGGMLTLDVALAADPPVDRAVVLSGVLIAESVDNLRAMRGKRTRFLLSHGHSDTILPFQGGIGTRELLSQAGYELEFHAFEGGHSIPPEVVAAAARFAFE